MIVSRHLVTIFAITTCATIAPSRAGDPDPPKGPQFPGYEVVEGVPPGYEVITISDEPGYYQRPGLADTGHVVWSRSDGPGMGHVYLYHRFEGARELSNGAFNDRWPDISPDASKIVWQRSPNSNPFSLVLYEHGVATEIEGSSHVYNIPVATSCGMIGWARRVTEESESVEIYTLEGGEIHEVISNGMTNTSARANCDGHFAWTRYNFSVSPWVSTIMLRRGGEIIEITEDAGTTTPQSPSLNDVGDVVWNQWNGEAYEVRKWRDGRTISLFEGYGPDINDSGDICFTPWDDVADSIKPYLFKNSLIYRLPDFELSGGKCAINERGEVAWYGSGESVTNASLFMLSAIQYPGDYDEDCGVTLQDSQAFTDCMGGPTAHGVITDERCRVFDFDSDNDVDFHDFGSLQQVFTGIPQSTGDCVPKITDFGCPGEGGDEQVR
jgi:hypothetical protein